MAERMRAFLWERYGPADAEHVALDHEGEAAEHRALGDPTFIGENFPDPGSELLVAGCA